MPEKLDSAPLDCRQFETDLQAYLEGESRPFVDSHAARCASCNGLLSDLKAIQSEAAALPEVDPPPQLWARIRTSHSLADAAQREACARFHDEVGGFLEGQPNAFVLAHENECASCHAVLDDLNAIQLAARDLPDAEPSPAVWNNLQQSIAQERNFAETNCKRFAKEVSTYLEGESAPFVSQHAAACGQCSTLLEDLQWLKAEAMALPEVEPSPELWAGVREVLASEGAFRDARCNQFGDELSAFMEGEPHPFVIAHAKECGACGSLLGDLELIRQTARELPDTEPSRAVWANVRARLAEEGAFTGSVRAWRRFLQLLPKPVPMGALAALMVLGLVLTMPPGTTGVRKAVQVASINSIAVQREPARTPPPEAISLAHVVSELEDNFKASEASMTPELKASYEKSLVSLDGSIRECLDSLQQEPRNALAHDYLLTAYTRKAEVLSSALEFEGR